jgi:hypothetical protein
MCALANGTQPLAEVKLAYIYIFIILVNLIHNGECHEQRNLYRRLDSYCYSHPEICGNHLTTVPASPGSQPNLSLCVISLVRFRMKLNG